MRTMPWPSMLGVEVGEGGSGRSARQVGFPIESPLMLPRGGG
jgi:hypothetical protein